MLEAFMKRTENYCVDKDLLNDDSYTFPSYGSSVTKCLNHLMGRGHNFIKVKNVKVLSHINGSDHLPKEATIQFHPGVHPSRHLF